MQIPIYLAAIGPRNTALAGEIADGWLPTFFSPEHVGMFRERLEEGAARAGRTLDGFDIAPQVSVHINDDIETARNFMRPALALYVGGMGSRKQNFYNALVCEYGFERGRGRDPGSLPGRQARGGLPGDPGRADRSRVARRAARRGRRATCRLSRRRASARCSFRRSATPASSSSSSCRRSRNWPPEPPRSAVSQREPSPSGSLRIFLGAFGQPGHAFPMLALGRRLVERGHRVTYETWERWREHVVAAGMEFVPAPEYPVFPTRERPLKPYEAVVRATAPTRAAIAARRPDVVVHDILTLAPALAAELEGIPTATLIPHLFPVTAPGFAPYSIGARLPRTEAGTPFWGAVRAAAREGPAPGTRRAQRDAAAAGSSAAGAAPRRPQRRPLPGRDVPAARVPARVAAAACTSSDRCSGSRRPRRSRRHRVTSRWWWSRRRPPMTRISG